RYSNQPISPTSSAANGWPAWPQRRWSECVIRGNSHEAHPAMRTSSLGSLDKLDGRVGRFQRDRPTEDCAATVLLARPPRGKHSRQPEKSAETYCGSGRGRAVRV